MKIHVFAAAFLSIALSAFQAGAAIIVVAPTGSTAGSFQVTTDITFTIYTASDASLIVLNEWVMSDGNLNNSAFSPNLSLSINGGAPASYLIAGFIDNHVTTLNQLTPNDGYLFLNNEIAVIAGDTITMKAGTYSLGATANFNPLASQTFEGSMFVADASGNQISNIVTVPEPSTTAFLIGGVALAAALRRRQK